MRRGERRDQIKFEVLSHLEDGLEHCGRDRSEILQSTNGSAVDDKVSDCYGLVDEIGAGVDPNEVDLESRLDEIRASVHALKSLLSPSSWFGEWQKHKYAIGPFVECLGQLRTLQERDLAAMKKRVEQKIENLRAHFPN